MLLQPGSIQALKEIQPVAKNDSIKEVIAQLERAAKESKELPCHSSQHCESRISLSVVTREDVVLNADHAIMTFFLQWI